MNVQFSTPILDLDEKPVKFENKELLLGDACTMALLYNPKNEEPDGQTKAKYWGLATLIKQSMKKGSALDMSAEDIVLLKTRVALIFGTMVTGRAWALLEGKE